MKLDLSEPYRARPIRCPELWESRGWRMKVYEAAYDRERPRRELVEAVKRVAAELLPQPAVAGGSYGVGFLCAHDGRGGCFAFVDWWAGENELHHEMYLAPGDRPGALEPAGPGALTACVWDLAIMAFEREAWLEAVLANPSGPDLDRYLELQLSADV